MKQKNEIRIIVDTNLWISFLIGRKLSCLLDLLSYPEFQLVVSSELINEVHEVFLRPKFSKYYTSENLDMLIKFMNESAVNFSLTDITPRCRDSKDDYLLELALVSNADILITGDRDLLDMKEIGTCSIVTAMEFDVYSSTIGRPTVLHAGLKEYYSIVIG